ncbi:hypothetical protein VTJ04DRAFT_5756 [Mycothermus thermophilus]|uniref:uncharacterized protein n=1 Tax=Humicola insolens TaxID=85995 RepID=UPI00374377EC
MWTVLLGLGWAGLGRLEQEGTSERRWSFMWHLIKVACLRGCDSFRSDRYCLFSWRVYCIYRKELKGGTGRQAGRQAGGTEWMNGWTGKYLSGRPGGWEKSGVCD